MPIWLIYKYVCLGPLGYPNSELIYKYIRHSLFFFFFSLTWVSELACVYLN